MDTPTPDPGPSLEVLFTDHARDVFRAALRVTGSASDAEDVVQTVFVRLLDRGHLRRLTDDPGPYLRRAGTNAGLDVLRRRRTAAAVDLDDQPALPADRRTEPDRQLDNLGLRRELRRAVASLTEKTGEIFALRYIEGLSNPEIADLIGTTPGVVAVTLHRARRTVQREMKSFLGDPS